MNPLEKILNDADGKVLLPFYGPFQMNEDIKSGRLDPYNDVVRVAMLGFYNMIPYVLVLVPTLTHVMIKASEYVASK